MKQYKRFETVSSYLLIALGACVLACNYYIFIIQNSFAPAGVNGIATMVQYKMGISISYMSLLINIPLAIASFFLIGKKFTYKTTLYVLVFSGVLLLFQKRVINIDRFVYYTGDARSTILGPVAAGAVNGVIYGLVVRCGGTTGGTDFIATYVHEHHPDLSFSKVLFWFNAAVALSSYFVYDHNVEPVILSIVYSFLTTNISGGIIRGGESAIKLEMITDEPDKLTDELIKKLRHSVTIFKAIGGYSKQEKTMLICVVNPHQIKDFMEIIAAYPGTFVCVSDVTHTIGNFKKITRQGVKK